MTSKMLLSFKNMVVAMNHLLLYYYHFLSYSGLFQPGLTHGMVTGLVMSQLPSEIYPDYPILIYISLLLPKKHLERLNYIKYVSHKYF